MYETTNFPNSYGITKITLYKKVHAFCRLGGDWYTNQLTISFTPVDEIPDYVYIDKAIEENCEQKDLIICFSLEILLAFFFVRLNVIGIHIEEREGF